MNGAVASPMLLLIAGLFLIGGVGLGGAWLIPAARSAVRPLLPLYTDEVVIVAPVLALTLSPAVVGWGLLSLFAVRGGWELRRTGRAAPQAGTALLLLALWGLSAVGFAAQALAEGRQAVLLLVYLAVESGDSAALLTGRLIGRRHPFPRLSPRKTLAGCVAGVLTAGGLGVAGGVALGLPFVQAVLLAAAMAPAGLAGDLLVSAVKRAAGVKDFPPLLLRHGGVLDIYDSFLFGLPVALMVLRFTT
jgi:CDP-diglyceride synthetase